MPERACIPNFVYAALNHNQAHMLRLAVMFIIFVEETIVGDTRNTLYEKERFLLGLNEHSRSNSNLHAPKPKLMLHLPNDVQFRLFILQGVFLFYLMI